MLPPIFCQPSKYNKMIEAVGLFRGKLLVDYAHGSVPGTLNSLRHAMPQHDNEILIS